VISAERYATPRCRPIKPAGITRAYARKPEAEWANGPRTPQPFRFPWKRANERTGPFTRTRKAPFRVTACENLKSLHKAHKADKAGGPLRDCWNVCVGMQLHLAVGFDNGAGISR
jgi:hypothetical protein